MHLQIDGTDFGGVVHMSVALHLVADGKGRVHANQAAASFSALRTLTSAGQASVSALQALAAVDSASTIVATFSRPDGAACTVTLEDVKVEEFEAETPPYGAGGPTEFISVSAGRITLSAGGSEQSYARDRPFYS